MFSHLFPCDMRAGARPGPPVGLNEWVKRCSFTTVELQEHVGYVDGGGRTGTNCSLATVHVREVYVRNILVLMIVHGPRLHNVPARPPNSPLHFWVGIVLDRSLFYDVKIL
jgi:hypothetical protein